MPQAEFHGWRGPTGALYVARDKVSGNPSLYAMDDVGDSKELGFFATESHAVEFQQWMDDTIAASGQANAMLLDQIGGDSWR